MLTIQEELEQAIAAHKKWLKHINMTIALSSYELESSATKTAENQALVEKVSQDTNCPLGKWLYSLTDQSILNSSFYVEVMTLHKLFHQEAGEVLGLAFEGQNIQAKAMIADNTPFTKHSQALIATLKAWLADVKST